MSGPLGYEYPAGAEHDERAPYNQTSYDECSECEGEGCDECHGTGELRPPTKEEIAIDRADRARDEAEDRDL